METEQRIKIHQLIEYIKQDPEFPFDTHDELEDILAHYNINMPKDPELRKIIETEVATIADQHQTEEITKIGLPSIDEWQCALMTLQIVNAQRRRQDCVWESYDLNVSTRPEPDLMENE